MIRRWVINYLTTHLVKAVSDEDIITLVNRDLFVGRRKLTPDEVMLLKEEAKHFLDSDLWKYLKKDLEWQAWTRMGAQSKTVEDMTFGKALFLSTDLIRKYLERVIRL